LTELSYDSFLKLIRSLKIDLPSFEMPQLRIRDITARLPVVQGGMGVGISLSGLASAVANQGGVGVIAANGIGMIEADYFKDGRAANIRALQGEIRKARSLTNGIIGVNLMVALNDFHDLLHTAVEEKVDVLFIGAGLPIKGMPVQYIRENNVKVVPIVSTARAAELIFKMWKRMYDDVPDGVVVEGPKAGGHLGAPEEEIDAPALQLETVVPQVRETLDLYAEEFQREIPLIAGGGVFTGEDMYTVMQLGAQAVQMGTRFAATEECDAAEEFKEAFVTATQEDIGIIKSPVGLPGRALINDFLTQAAEGAHPFKCPWQCLAGCKADKANYCISIALNNARKGRLSRGFVFAGSNAHRVEAVVPVKSLVKELENGYMSALFADIKGVAGDILRRIRELREEYRTAERTARTLRERYETALAARMKSIHDGGTAAIREEYRSAAARLADLQLRLTERVYAVYTLMMHGELPG